MTDAEHKEKYPVGTKIKYIGNRWDDTVDRGKVGTIVNFHGAYPIIFLPKSTHLSSFSTLEIPASWEVGWDSLKILPQKNQQLLFTFME